jgi:16S rRNA (guanine966-N2)-methyltransferase
MRIITGKYKGRLLEAPAGNGVRPATDRVKGTIFNMLQNRLQLLDIHVLDLFSGSGSLGFEALSRGAASVVFVDEGRDALDSVRANAEKVGCADNCFILKADAIDFLKQTSDRFELIFADPPYAYQETSRLPVLIFHHKLLKIGGFLIIEHGKHTVFEQSESYVLTVQKEFGNTRVSFFIHPS